MIGTCPACGKPAALSHDNTLVMPHRSIRNPSRLGGCEGAGMAPVEESKAKERAWTALQRAAERIGAAEHRAGRYSVRRNRRGRVTQGYSLSEAHQAVLDAMNALGRDEITPEQAMAVLHEHDVLEARTRRS